MRILSTSVILGRKKPIAPVGAGGDVDYLNASLLENPIYSETGGATNPMYNDM